MCCLFVERLQNRTELATLRKDLHEATKLSESTSEVHIDIHVLCVWCVLVCVMSVLPQDYASDFVSGKSSISVDEFVEGLVTQRSQYWLRKVKLDKFDDLAKSRRPVPVPRSRSRAPPTEGPPTPYSPPSHSLPPGSSPTGGPPTQSLPPYVTASTGMPQPAAPHPFPAAAYPGFQQQQRPVYPPPGQSYPQPQPVRPATGYSRAPPPRPAAYNQYRQHRY